MSTIIVYFNERQFSCLVLEIVRKPKKKRVEIPVYRPELYEGSSVVVAAECTLSSHTDQMEHKQIKVTSVTLRQQRCGTELVSVCIVDSSGVAPSWCQSV